MTDLNEKLKREIKAYLVKQGKSQRALAAEINLTPAALGNVLGSKRGLLTPNAVKVLDALGLELIAVPKDSADEKERAHAQA